MLNALNGTDRSFIPRGNASEATLIRPDYPELLT